MVALIQTIAAICVLAATWLLNSPSSRRRWGAVLGLIGSVGYNATTFADLTGSQMLVAAFIVLAYARGCYYSLVLPRPFFPSLRRTKRN